MAWGETRHRPLIDTGFPLGWTDENILKLDCVDGCTSCDHTNKTQHWIVHSEWWIAWYVNISQLSCLNISSQGKLIPHSYPKRQVFNYLFCRRKFSGWESSHSLLMDLSLSAWLRLGLRWSDSKCCAVSTALSTCPGDDHAEGEMIWRWRPRASFL